MHTANRNEESRRARTLAFPLNDCECAQVNRISFASTVLFLYANAAALLFAAIVLNMYKTMSALHTYLGDLFGCVCVSYASVCMRVLSFSLGRTSVARLFFSHQFSLVHWIDQICCLFFFAGFPVIVQSGHVQQCGQGAHKQPIAESLLGHP